MEHHEPKSGPESATGSQDGAVIFMSDASAEADRLSAALRARGYAVVDVPLGLLAGRAAVQRPAAVICDADAPGTLETLRRMQGAAGGRAIEVVLVGETAGASTPGRAELEAESSGLFTRPVSADDLVSKVEQIIGPASNRGSSPMGSLGRPPVLVAAARKPYRYEGHRLGARSPLSAAPPPGPASAQGPPSSAPSGRPSTLPPALTSRSASVVPQPMGVVPHARLSPELEQLLGRAEQRMRQVAPGTTLAERLSPEDEVEAVLPAELLAALDEPLEIDDEDGEDSAAGTHGGGSESGAKGATRGTTSDGGAGTAGGGRTAARREVTASGPSAPAPEPPPQPQQVTRDEAEFQGEPPTAPPVRPSQFPPPSLQSKTTLGPPNLAVESVRPSAPPPELHEAEAPPSIVEGDSAPPEPPITTKPPRGEPAKPEPTRPEQARAPTQPPASMGGKQLPEPSVPDIPAVLGDGDGFRAVARAVTARFGGSIAFEDSAGIRRVVFRDGDFVTAASSSEAESLVAFLTERGDLAPDVAQKVGRRVPPFGRHAGAALIGHSHLRQDELWPVLRSHAEWIIGRVARMQRGAASLEFEVPQRLQAEPGVFGGATGAEVLLEIARRTVSPAEALLRLGGRSVPLAPGPSHGLLAECALSESELSLVKSAGSNVDSLLDRSGSEDFASVLWALVELGVLVTEAAPRPKRAAEESDDVRHDPLDAVALRERIAARRGLVEEGDYFAVLGIGRGATSYDIRRAYLSARKSFDPARLLTPETVDLKDDLESILEVLDEAYEILGDATRRERYRRALDAVPRV